MSIQSKGEAMPKITRRAALGTIAAVSTVAGITGPALAASATHEADRRIFELEAEYVAAHADWMRKLHNEGVAQQAASERELADIGPRPVKPEWPVDLRKRVSEIPLGEFLNETHPVNVAIAEFEAPYRAELAAWKEAHDKAEKDPAFLEAGRLNDEACNHCCDLHHETMNEPVTTLPGLLAKLRVHDMWTSGDCDTMPEEFEAIRDDIFRIAGQAA